MTWWTIELHFWQSNGRSMLVCSLAADLVVWFGEQTHCKSDNWLTTSALCGASDGAWRCICENETGNGLARMNKMQKPSLYAWWIVRIILIHSWKLRLGRCENRPITAQSTRSKSPMSARNDIVGKSSCLAIFQVHNYLSIDQHYRLSSTVILHTKFTIHAILTFQKSTAQSLYIFNATLYLIVLPVRIRIHCGIERFCFNFFANLRLTLNVLWAA